MQAYEIRAAVLRKRGVPLKIEVVEMEGPLAAEDGKGAKPN